MLITTACVSRWSFAANVKSLRLSRLLSFSHPLHPTPSYHIGWIPTQHSSYERDAGLPLLRKLSYALWTCLPRCLCCAGARWQYCICTTICICMTYYSKARFCFLVDGITPVPDLVGRSKGHLSLVLSALLVRSCVVQALSDVVEQLLYSSESRCTITRSITHGVPCSMTTRSGRRSLLATLIVVRVSAFSSFLHSSLHAPRYTRVQAAHT